MRPLCRRIPVIVLISLACGWSAFAQTFEVGQDAPANTKKQKKQEKNHAKAADSGSAQEAPSIGWGAGLEVAREAKAAQEALRTEHFNEATFHAEKAAKAAPQNADLWFLYGYAARLAGHYQASLAAFKHGLSLKPSSVQGLSGIAQTYIKMGQREQAKEILLQVLAANPSSHSDLQLAENFFSVKTRNMRLSS